MAEGGGLLRRSHSANADAKFPSAFTLMIASVRCAACIVAILFVIPTRLTRLPR